MRHLLNFAAAAAAFGLIVQMGGTPGARADTSGTDPTGRTAGRAPVLGTTPRPTAARGAAISAPEFPADPKNFDRHHRPLRPSRRGAAHTILARPSPANRIPRPPGKRGGGPSVGPGALDPRKAPTNVGAIVVAYIARHPATPAPTPTPVTLSHRRGAMTPGAKRTATIDITQQSVTGINRWWSYEEGSIPGVGRWMINAYFGNLIVQADDMDVPHRGIDLAFRRTYNSFSRHDFSGTDGATEIGQYGSGWTNTWDAHLSTNGCPNTGYSWAGFYGFSVHDVDGARYDYCFNSAGQLIPPPGMQGTSLVANPDGGSFYWTKKSGTQYTFYAPYYSGTSAAYSGRIYRISGRNQNNYIQFTYAWNPDASSSGNLTNIYASTDNGGAQATLTFATFNGQQLLSQLTRPDGATITYGYDPAGELISVSKPAPNNSGTPAVETYNGYQSFLMVAGPRWNAGSESDGGYVAFYMDETTTAQVDGIEWVGVVNFAPNDGTSTVLQPSITTGPILYRWEGVSVTPTYTSFSDTEGHSAVQYVDGTGRPTIRQEYTGSQWLQTMEGWDTSNDLVSSTDARGNETDFAYDVDGNTVASAAPPPTPGASRPTSLYSYDARDNVLAYCDPIAVHAMQADWTSPPAAPPPGQGGLCPTQSTAAARLQWTPVPNEPFGEVTLSTSPGTPAAPSGYQRTYVYSAGPQSGADYGLPTTVTGAAISQNDARTPSRQPQQSFWYDGNGNLVCYGIGNGQWLLGYDALGRRTSTADPDDSSSGTGVCGKTGAQPNWNTTTRTIYFPDGSVSSKQTASQLANGVSTSFTYDLDREVVTETQHYGCVSAPSCTVGVTRKFYDGADRLVEVALPYDANDIQGYPMTTRYIYDLSQGGTTQYQGIGLSGYGNLVKIQELLSGTIITPFTYATYVSFSPYPLSSGIWTDVRATSFDGLDRALSTYEAAFASQAKLANTYDGAAPGGGAAQLGLLSAVTLATNEVKQYTYDALGRLTDTAYAGDNGATSPVHVRYDADSHPISRGTNTLGNEMLQYDGAGELISLSEPASLGGVTLTYDYYADGTRKDLGFASPIYTANLLYQYTYRPDGRRSSLTLNNGSSFTWTYTQAGRLQTQADPFTGHTITPDNYYTIGNSMARHPYYPSSLTYVPESYAYDAFGRTTGITLPAGVFSQSTTGFDLEDGVTGISGTSVQSPNSVTTVACAQSNVRNEKLPTYNGTCGGWLYNGAVLAPQQSALPDNQGIGPAPWTLDARAGMLKSWQGTSESSGNASSGQYTYDASGRLTSDAEQLDRPWRASDGTMAGNRVFSTGTRTKTYDAENRLRSQQTSPAAGATYPLWGESNPGGYWNDIGQGSAYELQAVDYNANSHPVRFAATHTPDYANTQPPVTLIWLWDGNDVVAQCSYNSPSTQCAAYGFAIEGLGSYFPMAGYLAVNDRSLAGQIISRHDSDGFSGMKPTGRNSRNYFFGGVNASAAPGSVSQDTNTGPDTRAQLPGTKVALDGWTLDNNTWQGVRTYDASVGQWTTPDAYAGDVHDPMTQKPFMWNRNNPYAYSDPSGYNPFDDFIHWVKDRISDHRGSISVPMSPGLSRDMVGRLAKTNNSVASDLKQSTVDAAIREANGGMGVAKTGGGVFDHVSSVQRGVNSINKTLDHITTMEGKYAGSPSDMQALQTTKAAYEAIKDAVRQQFQKAGVDSAVKW